MKECYRVIDFRAGSRALIATLNGIAEEYMEADLTLTVRQLYYQAVARGHVENTKGSYNRIASLVNDARDAGLMDWDAIEDRTREFVRLTRWGSPAEILRDDAETYHEDLWIGQPNRVFVIIEKEALTGVLEGVCREYDVPLLAARGYPSGTVLRAFAEMDLDPASADGQKPVVLHLGDHDPSGLDMTRDLKERLELYGNGIEIELHRVALNMDQIEALNPPKNPAKETDVRFAEYRKRFGESSWELDALTPTYLVELVRKHIEAWIEKPALWKERHEAIGTARAQLAKLAESWADGDAAGGRG